MCGWWLEFDLGIFKISPVKWGEWKKFFYFLWEQRVFRRNGFGYKKLNRRNGLKNAYLGIDNESQTCDMDIQERDVK